MIGTTRLVVFMFVSLHSGIQSGERMVEGTQIAGLDMVMRKRGREREITFQRVAFYMRHCLFIVLFCGHEANVD